MKINGNTIILAAESFSIAAHGSIKQKRKYTGEPYHEHTREVATILGEFLSDPYAIAAAHLHDVVEDVGPHMQAVIRKEFGDLVADLVMEVTDVSTPEDGNREARKKKDLAHLMNASGYGQSIKYADLIANTASIVKHDREFAKVYLKEKRAILEQLTDGNPHLYQRAWKVLINAEWKLENGVS